MVEGFGSQGPTSNVELLAVSEGYGRESQFCLGAWSLVGCPCSIGWFYTCAHVGNTNWTQ